MADPATERARLTALVVLINERADELERVLRAFKRETQRLIREEQDAPHEKG